MLPFTSPERALLHEAVTSVLARHHRPSEPSGAGPVRFDEVLWKELRGLGVPELSLPGEEHGGSLSDAGVVAYACGRSLAAVPVVESCAAARLLARFPDAAPAVARNGSAVATVAIQPACDGVSRSVPAGAVARLVVSLHDDGLVLEELSEDRGLAAVPNLADLPLADHRPGCGRRTLLAGGTLARAEHRRAVWEWKVLAAALLAGIASRALEIAVQYTTQRFQFGTPIGSFQAVQHRLADLATAVDGAGLLAAKAAWCLDQARDDASRTASMAYAFCGEIAQRSAGEALHLHGGYGFTLESEIQSYFRQAKAWSVLGGNPMHEYETIAGSLFGVDEASGELRAD
jgi:alkylation response protein AidB-like acyl-CoA dehydrogenase